MVKLQIKMFAYSHSNKNKSCLALIILVQIIRIITPEQSAQTIHITSVWGETNTMNAETAPSQNITHRGSSGLFLENGRTRAVQAREIDMLWAPMARTYPNKQVTRKRTKPSVVKSPDVDRQNPDGNAALHYAAFAGELGKVRLLLLAGADANLRNFRGDSPLICAAYNGHCNLIMALVAAGAELDAQDEDGRTALTWAVIRGQADAVRLLVSLGASLSICDNVDNTPLLWAVIHNRGEICDILIQAEEKLGTLL